MSNDERDTSVAPAGDAPEAEKLAPIAPARGSQAARARWARRILGLLARAAALGVILGLKFAVCDADRVDCMSAPRDTNAGRLAAACEREYEETGDPAVALQYARALYLSGSYERAGSIARAQLPTKVRADALQLLGRISIRGEQWNDARSALERARELHRAESRLAGVATDEQGLATVLKGENRFADALRMLDRCIQDARTSADRADGRRAEGFCRLLAAQTLAENGFTSAAKRELNSAEPLLDAERDRASLHLERANLHQDLGEDHLAIVELQRALPGFEGAGLTKWILAVHLNLAYSLAEVGRLDEAAQHLAEAESLDVDNDQLPQRLNLAGRIAYRRRDLKGALQLLERADRAAQESAAPADSDPSHADEPDEPDEVDEERIEIAGLAAEVALAAGDLGAAERWGRSGVEQAEQIRRAQSAVELRPAVLSSRRTPYELLFAALARAGRTDDALIAFDQWYGRTLLDALARPAGADRPVTLEDAALQTETLREILPSLSSAPIGRNQEPREVLDAVRSVELLALVEAGGEIWRVTAAAGRVSITSLGREKALRGSFEGFLEHPTDSARAEELGALILTDDLVRDTREALRVIVDVPLRALPVAALRRHGRPLVAARPIVHAPRLSALRCAPSPEPPLSALVLADAKGDLPGARREAHRVAALLGTTALVGDAATSLALLAGPPADIVHIATHADFDAGAASLGLHDRPVLALQILARKLTASRVFLDTCHSAVAIDREGATSLATAFLAGGADQVVATLRSVSDTDAEEVTRLFYGASGALDPVGALAAAQRSLSETTNRDWPYFVVFGQDTCPIAPNRQQKRSSP